MLGPYKPLGGAIAPFVISGRMRGNRNPGPGGKEASGKCEQSVNRECYYSYAVKDKGTRLLFTLFIYCCDVSITLCANGYDM